MKSILATSTKRTIIRDLLATLILTLIFLGVSLGTANYWVRRISMERELGQRATDLAHALTEEMQENIWTLNDSRLRDHFDLHYGEVSGVTCVRILTASNGPIFEKVFTDEENTITRRTPVLRDGALVGYIDVSLSRQGMDALLATMTRASSLMILVACLTILLVTTALMRRLMWSPMRDLVYELRAIARGDYGRKLPEARNRELDLINQEVNSMSGQIAERTDQLKREIQERQEAEAQLQKLKDRLEIQVNERTLALQHAYEELNRETRERRHMQNEVLEISRREQQRIGRDLHDALGQQLAGTSFLLGSLEKRLRDKALPESDLAAEIGGHLRDAVSKTRHIAYGLAPTDITEEGLIDGLGNLASNMQSLFNMECAFASTPGCHVSDPIVAMHVYRIAQEALHNAASHGDAKRAWLSLAVDGKRGVLTVRDDGTGMERTEPSVGGMGIRIMQFRADTIGGHLNMHANEAGGVTITATFKDERPV
ncbi:MAG: HAMP domain-containing protein [Lentisphaerae bacterium]|nr:HAMP domain-containing protein [Lentisphaerota bacterium]